LISSNDFFDLGFIVAFLLKLPQQAMDQKHKLVNNITQVINRTRNKVKVVVDSRLRAR
jgi:hypothetical protein